MRFFLSLMIEATDYFFPVFCSIEERVVEIYIAIPRFFEEDTGDIVSYEFIGVLHRIIDHEGYIHLFTYLRLRASILGKVIHEVDMLM